MAPAKITIPLAKLFMASREEQRGVTRASDSKPLQEKTVLFFRNSELIKKRPKKKTKMCHSAN